ncbi:MAG TPA: DUF664 domain-containing protein [Acidimicrobiales bacterium]
MISAELLADAFERVREVVHQTLDGLTAAHLAYRIDPDANSIGWLIWHLTRIQDDHIAGAAGVDQVWTSAGWLERLELPFEAGATGYGHRSEDVAAVRPSSPDLLRGYFDAVHQRTISYVQQLGEDDFDVVVDDSWDPPVTLGVRLISVISDNLQHAGQAALVRGCAVRR